jgi:hypothetical protein
MEVEKQSRTGLEALWRRADLSVAFWISTPRRQSWFDRTVAAFPPARDAEGPRRFRHSLRELGELGLPVI